MVKDFFMDKVKRTIKGMPWWLKKILKKVPGFSKLIESAETDDLDKVTDDYEQQAKKELQKKVPSKKPTAPVATGDPPGEFM